MRPVQMHDAFALDAIHHLVYYAERRQPSYGAVADAEAQHAPLSGRERCRLAAQIRKRWGVVYLPTRNGTRNREMLGSVNGVVAEHAVVSSSRNAASIASSHCCAELVAAGCAKAAKVHVAAKNAASVRPRAA